MVKRYRLRDLLLFALSWTAVTLLLALVQGETFRVVDLWPLTVAAAVWIWLQHSGWADRLRESVRRQ